MTSSSEQAKLTIIKALNKVAIDYSNNKFIIPDNMDNVLGLLYYGNHKTYKFINLIGEGNIGNCRVQLYEFFWYTEQVFISIVIPNKAKSIAEMSVEQIIKIIDLLFITDKYNKICKKCISITNKNMIFFHKENKIRLVNMYYIDENDNLTIISSIKDENESQVDINSNLQPVMNVSQIYYHQQYPFPKEYYYQVNPYQYYHQGFTNYIPQVFFISNSN